VVRAEGGPTVRRKKGAIEKLYTIPPERSAVVCLDEMGPESAKSFPGKELTGVAVRSGPSRQQTTGGAVRGTCSERSSRRPGRPSRIRTPLGQRPTWIDFLERVQRRIPGGVGQVDAVLDNLPAHRGTDALLFSLAHPRWEFVFQPTYAAYLNLIEPWWKLLRSLALKGRRFETWDEIEAAIERVTAYWNVHRHPFVWTPTPPSQTLTRCGHRPERPVTWRMHH